MAVYLATGEPIAKVEGDQIAVSIPSGKGSVEIALDPHQAFELVRQTRAACMEVFDEVRARPTCDLIAFPSERIRRA